MAKWEWANDSPVWLKPRRTVYFLVRSLGDGVVEYRRNTRGHVITYRTREQAVRMMDRLNGERRTKRQAMLDDPNVWGAFVAAKFARQLKLPHGNLWEPGIARSLAQGVRNGYDREDVERQMAFQLGLSREGAGFMLTVPSDRETDAGRVKTP